MRAAIVSDNIITNIIVLPDGADPAAHGAMPLPEGKWIGDQYDDPSTPPTESESDTSVWQQLDAAYREGVASAYDS